MKIRIDLLRLFLFHPSFLSAFVVPSLSRKSLLSHCGNNFRTNDRFPRGLRAFFYDEVEQPKNQGEPQSNISQGIPGSPTHNPHISDGVSSPLQTTHHNAPNPHVPTPDIRVAKNPWETLFPVAVQGGALRTYSSTSASVARVQLLMKTDGRPLFANVELWEGPDNSPQKMGIYVEDGGTRPFSTVIETPRGHSSIAIRNTGSLEFPLAACVEEEIVDASGNGSVGLRDVTEKLYDIGSPQIIQGGALRIYPFTPSVSSVQVLLRTDGRPMSARIELMQGPSNNKQVIEVYCENGSVRPFFAVIECPGFGNVVRIINAASMEFPLMAWVEPYVIEAEQQSGGNRGGWDQGGGGGWDTGSTNVFFLDSRS